MISKWEDIPNVVTSLTQLWLWAQKPHKPAVQTFHLWQETNQNIFILCLVSKKNVESESDANMWLASDSDWHKDLYFFLFSSR